MFVYRALRKNEKRTSTYARNNVVSIENLVYSFVLNLTFEGWNYTTYIYLDLIFELAVSIEVHITKCYTARN